MSKRLIDYDPLTGMASYFHWEDDKFRISYEQDVGQAIENNKRTAIESDAKLQMKKDWVKYASVPLVIAQKWKRELGVDLSNRDHQKAYFRLINDPDYRGFKTTTIYHEPK